MSNKIKKNVIENKLHLNFNKDSIYMMNINKNKKKLIPTITKSLKKANLKSNLPPIKFNNGKMSLNFKDNKFLKKNIDSKFKIKEDEMNKILEFKNREKELEKRKEEEEEDGVITAIDFIETIKNDSSFNENFCYMVQRSNFYDWIIVEYEVLNKKFKAKSNKLEEYMTIGSRGITHHIDSNIYMISLEEWQREYNLYNKLKKITFFKNYKKWKNFILWKKYRSRSHYNKTKQFLEKNLLIVDKNLRDPIFEIKNKCYNFINEINLIDLNFNSSLKLDNFVNHQNSFIVKQDNLLQNIIQKDIRDIVKNACSSSLTFFKKENRILDNDEKNDKEEKNNGLVINYELNKDMPYTREATIRTHHKRLAKFIKYIDYLIVDGKIQFINSSISKIYTYLENNFLILKEKVINNGGVTPILNINFLLKNKNLIYDPDNNHVKANFENIINKSIEYLCENNNYFYDNNELSKYTKNDEEEVEMDEIKLNLLKLLENYHSFKIKKNEINNMLQNIFNYIIENNKEFNNLLHPFLFSIDFNISDIKNKNRNEIRDILITFIESNNKLLTFEDKVDVGLFSLERKEVINIMKSSFTKCIKDIEKNLPIIVENKIDNYNLKLDNIRENLTKPVYEIDQFIEFLTIYEDSLIEWNELNEEYILINDLNNLVENSEGLDFKIKIHESLKQNKIKMNSNKDKIKKSIEEIENRLDTDKTRICKDLNLQIPTLFDKLKDIENGLELLKMEEINAFNWNTSIFNKKIDLEKMKLLNFNNKELLKNKKNKNNTTENEETNLKNIISDITSLYQEFEDKEELLLNKYKVYYNDFIDLNNLAAKWRRFQDILEMEKTNIDPINEFYKEFITYYNFFNLYISWRNKIEEWNKIKLLGINLETLNNELDKNKKILASCIKEIENNQNFLNLKEDFENFEQIIHLIEDLQQKSLSEEEWIEIKELIKLNTGILYEDFNPSTIKFNLEFIEKKNFIWFKNEISLISTRSAKELDLKDQLKIIDNFIKSFNISTVKYKNSKDIFILADNEELKRDIEENILNISNIINDRFGIRLKNEAQRKQKELVFFQKYLDLWEKCQRDWMYLENILLSGEMNKELSKEYKLFNKEVHKPFTKLVKDINRDNSKIKKLYKENDKAALEDLKNYSSILDLLQKNIIDYLENKRLNFGRLFFLSNDDLIDLLSNSKNFERIQIHMPKIFESIKMITLSNTNVYDKIISIDNEKLDFNNGFPYNDTNIIESLKQIENNVLSLVKQIIKNSYYDRTSENRISWIFNHQAQGILTSDSIMWTMSTQECFENEDSLESLYYFSEVLKEQLEEVIEKVRNPLEDTQRKLLISLITQDVHYRDIIDNLIDDKVLSKDDFKWAQQLKFYLDDYTAEVYCKQINAKINYGNEFLGIPSKLAITPLTDRCWMTITASLNIGMGCAPIGPAGTGKTESTKDLAKNLGKQCIVFNCSEQVTVQMMYSQFMGLIYTGSWICLDEFNRINIEVLSVIAQQISSMKNGLFDENQKFEFHDKTIENANFKYISIFTTMNPGYAGRTELPDNLKVLFRPIAMMVPDFSLIAEILLYSEGILNAKNLSVKMTKLYQLAKEQLSKQNHYDFGLRALKSILSMAGNLKRQFPNEDENILIIKAMKDVNNPKFLNEDIILFEGIIQDLFPGVKYDKKKDETFYKNIENTWESKGLEKIPKLIDKCMQFHDLISIKFGTVILGSAFTGKSSLINTLKNTYDKISEKNSNFKSVNEIKINPKSITMSELYGKTNTVTGDFNYGLASKYLLDYTLQQDNTYKWLTFDGPVDSLWIENLNSVLDDSMTLCLSNGKRIKLNWDIRILFEVEDLKQASPATISRVGIIYLDNSLLNYTYLLKTSLNNLKSHFNFDKEVYEIIFNKLNNGFAKAINFFQKNNNISYLEINENQLIDNIIKILKAVLCKLTKNYTYELINKKEFKENVLNKVLLFSYFWGIFSICNISLIGRFERVINSIFNLEDLPNGSLYDSFIYEENNGEFDWVKWENILPKFEFSLEKNWFDLVVPNKSTMRYSYILNLGVEQLYSIMLIGNSGNGKTTIIQNCLNKLIEEEKITKLSCNFSAQSSPQQVINLIENKLNSFKKNGINTYLPNTNTFSTLFIDDISMPNKEEYGAQPPIELLRQIIDQGGFYDTENLTWNSTSDLLLISSGSTKTLDITPRFLRHFHLLILPDNEFETMHQIFSILFKNILEYKGFNTSITSFCDEFVSSTLFLYKDIIKKLFPTPKKPFYIFNLRDVSKIFQGMALIENNSNFSKKLDFLNLWINECSRVFSDKFIERKDRNLFDNMLKDQVTNNLKENINWDEYNNSLLIYGTFMDPDTREYKKINDYDKLWKQINYYMENIKMNIELFKLAVSHLCRISRILSLLRGNLLFIGLSGTGKKTLIQLASEMSGCTFMMLEPGKNFGIREFRKEISEKILYSVGIENKKINFLLPDTHILKESFLEEINTLVNSGEINFEKDFIDKIKPELENIKNNIGYLGSPMDLFIQRIKENLHISLAMNPIGDKLRNRIRNFPSIVNCFTVNCWNEWPNEALKSIAFKRLKKIDTIDNTILVECFVHSHLKVLDKSKEFMDLINRKNYITPKNYWDLLNTFNKIYKHNVESFYNDKNKFEVGLKKMDESNKKIEILKNELIKMEPILIKKDEEQEILIRDLEKDKDEAKIVKDKVQEEEYIVQDKANEIGELNNKVKKQLEDAKPKLKKAVDALDKLGRAEIADLKNSKMDGLIKELFELVFTLLEQNTDKDYMSKTIKSDSNFMKYLKNIEPRKIKLSVMDSLKKKRENYKNLTQENLEKITKSAIPLLDWINNIMDSYIIFVDVQVLEKKSKEMQENYDLANKELEVKRNELRKTEAKVKELEEFYKINKNEKDKLKEQISKTSEKLINAEKLKNGLADEEIRWIENIENLKVEEKFILGNSILISTSLTYLGTFNKTYRDELLIIWKQFYIENDLLIGEDFSLLNSIKEENELREWNAKGLPNDTTSLLNGIWVSESINIPYMIDPQMQAVKWIKNLFINDDEYDENSNIICIKGNNEEKMTQTIINCIKSDQPCLVEESNIFLPPLLDPLFFNKYYFKGTHKYLKIADKEYEIGKNFKLYFCTKLNNPNLLPEIFIRVSVINFSVTEKGLDEQLLSEVIAIVLPEIEDQKNSLIKSIAREKSNLKNIENKILELLNNSKGDILEDKDLIQNLEESKIKSINVKNNIVKSEEAKLKIENARVKYVPVSQRGSLIYFSICELSKIDSMYQFSLNYFVRLFINIIENSEKADNINERCEIFIKNITSSIFKNICKGLFNKHKIIFSFLLATKIALKEDFISNIDLEFILKGINISKDYMKFKKPSILDIHEDLWKELSYIGNYNLKIKNFAQSLIENNKNLEKFYNFIYNDSYENINKYDNLSDLSSFDILILGKILSKENVLNLISSFINNYWGNEFVSTEAANIEESYNDCDSFTPLIFLLSSGSDPLNNINSLSKIKNMNDNKITISLGQGQEMISYNSILKGIKEGLWVILQNCHLSKSFMPILLNCIDIINDLSAGNTNNTQNKNDIENNENENEVLVMNDNFRLILTSKPCEHFPVTILQNSVKLTNEPPKGIKSNLLKSFDNFDDNYLNKIEKPEWRTFIFSLSLFHAVILERIKFGKTGWNIKYDFNDSDLSTSLELLNTMISENNDIPWEDIKYLIGEINYGGRVTDEFDRRTLKVILNLFVNKNITQLNYKYSKSEKYYIPNLENVLNIKNYIKELPNNDLPDIFGMNENAETLYKLQQSNEIISTLLNIQPKDKNKANDNPDDIVLKLIKKFKENLPKTILKDGEKKAKVVNLNNPLEICLVQEIERFNNLTVIITNSIKNLDLAILGEVLMNEELDEMYNCFLNNKIPMVWKKFCYPTLKQLSSFYEDYLNRIMFFSNWYLNNIPNIHYLTYFFFPQGFLTAILQAQSRKTKIPIDKLMFFFDFKNVENVSLMSIKPPEDGLFIYGLLMEGANFDFSKNSLADCHPGKLIYLAPLIHFIPREIKEKDYEKLENCYQMPCYKTHLRNGLKGVDNFIININCPTKSKLINNWILNGAAFLCEN